MQKRNLSDEAGLCQSISDLSDDQYLSYGSIFHQLKEVHTECTDPCEFMHRAFEIIWLSWALTIFLILLAVLPIIMLVMGTSYRDDCPKEPKIPIYHMVGGTFGLLKVLLMLWRQKQSRSDDFSDEEDEEDAVMSRCLKFTGYVLSIFLAMWFAVGNVWFLGIWKPKFKQPLHEPGNWCSEPLYMFTFYQIVTCYCLIGLAILVLICIMLMYAMYRLRKSHVAASS
ncbi:transmembrane protein 272-like isoform X2 [Gigantopelta aegis]|uniref:transmembrane protein 272-like isoform X2 n=1 Tax=Gigantopelta aegis TaxID=1735272 RepID=UPI001B88DA15|nr:transmembrane protein 272-like isoform X2 [Gigantopelta aegis]